MMFLRAAIAFAMVFSLEGFARAEDKEPAHGCEPWPNCQLDHLIITPGAPNTGLRPQGRAPGIEVQDKGPSEYRGSLRLPESDVKPK